MYYFNVIYVLRLVIFQPSIAALQRRKLLTQIPTQQVNFFRGTGFTPKLTSLLKRESNFSLLALNDEKRKARFQNCARLLTSYAPSIRV